MENTTQKVETKKTDSQVKTNSPDRKKLSLAEIRQMIYNRIKDTYYSEKGKNFICHLIRAFLPISKVSLIQKASGKMECCITNKVLLSVEELTEILRGQDPESVMAYLVKKTNDWSSKGNGDTNGHPMDKLLKRKFMGIKCNTSEKYLSEMAWQELNRFAVDEVTNGNKHISSVIVDQKKKEENPDKQGIGRRKKNDIKVDRTKVEVQEYVNPKPAVQTLSDNSILKQLSEQMSKAETEKSPE